MDAWIAESELQENVKTLPNIASVFKSEISRVARKEARAEISGIKKSSSQHRSDIAALKRRLAALEQTVRQLGKTARPKPTQGAEDTKAHGIRFTAARLIAQRERLGLRGVELAKLLGVSSQSVHKWENELASPRARQIALIATLNKMGKRVAAARLAEIEGQAD